MIKIYFVEINCVKKNSEKITRKILERFVDVEPQKIVILKSEYGKPYLRDYPNVHYNIAHTKDAFICVVADSVVGVDIERVKPFNKHIVEKFFTQNEQDYIFSIEDDKDKRFCEIWTRKEAYVKWLGKGLSVPFESFDTLKDFKDKIITFPLKNCYISICMDNYH